MKKLIIISTLLIYSCSPKTEGLKHIEQKHYDLDLPNTHATITEYTIDGCQYIGYLDGYQGNYITHKGNCNNSIHKTNQQ
jgi:hypothetical protein